MSFNVKRSFTEHVVTTPTADFNIGFEFDNVGADLDQRVNVLVDNKPADEQGYNVRMKNDITVELTPDVVKGLVRIQRETNIDNPLNVFSANALFVAKNLDQNFKQVLHSQQEVRDGFNKLNGDILPLVTGLEEALVKADEASKAAQEAAKAAEEAAQATRSADQVFEATGLTQQQWNNGVNTQVDLLGLSTAKDGNRVFVKSIQQWFTYTPDTQEAENGVTVVGKWVMDVPSAYYASWFCPNSSIDNVNEPQDIMINTIYQYAASKGRPLIIDNIYYVESTKKGGAESYPPLNPFNGGVVSHAIRVQSNSVLAFVGEGELKLVPNNQDFTSVLLVHDVENYVILDPKCKGDRDAHLTETGEQGICYHFGASKNGYVRNPKAYNAWGDGFYFGFTFYVKPFIDVIVPTNLTIDNLYGYDLRRNGISLCGADNLKINGGYIEKVDGVAPKAGIDIEPEEDTAFTDKMFIRNTTLHNMTFVSCGYPYAHNVFGNRDVDVVFTGITRLVNRGVINSWIPMLLNCQLEAESADSYQQNGGISFENVYVTDVGSNLAFKYLFVVSSPEKSLEVTIDKYEFDSTNYEPEIALARSSLYAKSDGITVSKFTFKRQINQVSLGFEANTSDPVPSINYYLGFHEDINIVYLNRGITFNGGCYIGGSSETSGYFLNENEMINNVIISPAPNPADGGAVYARVNITNKDRVVRYTLHPSVTPASVGYGLQVVSSDNIFKACTSRYASIELKIKSWVGVIIKSSHGDWVDP